MKKNYEKPTVEVVKFQYRDQVVAASTCTAEHDQTDYLTQNCKWTGGWVTPSGTGM